jgi:hypothetical protein
VDAPASRAKRACSSPLTKRRSVPSRARRRASARPNGIRSSSATSPEWA